VFQKNTWKLFDVKSNNEQYQHHISVTENKQLQKTVTFLWMISSVLFKLDTIEQHNVTICFFHFRKPSEGAVRTGGSKYQIVWINRPSDFFLCGAAFERDNAACPMTEIKGFVTTLLHEK
jgi:hypothetical protein